MNKFAKIIALVMALAMVLSMGAVAFAAEGDTYTISAPGTDTAHTYRAYQIFAGDYHQGVLSNVVWGSGVNAVGLTYTAESKAADLAKDTATEADAAAFAEEISGHLSNTYYTITPGEEPKAVAAGYYLIMDDHAVTGQHAATRYLLHVAGNVEIDPKSAIPESHKTQNTTGGVDNSQYLHRPVDVNIGDKVYYHLAGTVAANVAHYDYYNYQFVDELSKGLTFKKYLDEDETEKNVKVYLTIGGVKKEVTDYFVIATEAAAEGAMKITISAMKSEEGAVEQTLDLQSIAKEVFDKKLDKDSTVDVYYSATLNENAIVGNPGNPNKSHLEFSNNPNKGYEGQMGDTPDEIVYAFTYKLIINKVDGTDNTKKLANAVFVLKNAAGKYATVDANGKLTGWVNTEDAATKLTTNADGQVAVTGLDSGNYTLKETAAPAGYNSLKGEVAVEIKAELSVETNKIADLEFVVTVEGRTHQNKGEQTDAGFTGAGTVTIQNNKGNVLPSTGGMGTTLFYVVGAILMLGAGVVLVTKKRMEK